VSNINNEVAILKTTLMLLDAQKTRDEEFREVFVIPDAGIRVIFKYMHTTRITVNYITDRKGWSASLGLGSFYLASTVKAFDNAAAATKYLLKLIKNRSDDD
jgi:hypothetical protein